MTSSPFSPIQPASIDWQDTTPVAVDFDDPYFSRQDGASESDYVFLQGNRLTERFRELPASGTFVIGEKVRFG